MNFPINWDEEFYVIEELKDTLCNMTDLPSSFKQKVLQFWAMADSSNTPDDKQRDKERISKSHVISANKYRIYWLMAYDLGRFMQRCEKQSESYKLIENCKNECCSKKQQLNGKSIKTQYHPLELWAFACRWAELELRSK